jgi:ribosome-associated protein
MTRCRPGLTLIFIHIHSRPFMVKCPLATMDSRTLARLCREFADNKKAENIVILDVRKLSSVTDYFVIASGTSEPHLRAVVDEITDRLRTEHEVRPRAVDGTVHGAWVVLDFFDVIVHIMRPDARERYDLESLWGDAARLRPGKSGGPAPKTTARARRH